MGDEGLAGDQGVGGPVGSGCQPGGKRYLTSMSEESSLALVDAITAYRSAFTSRNDETSTPVPSGSSFSGGDLVLAVPLDGQYQGEYTNIGGHRGVHTESGEYRGKYTVIPDDCNRLDCIKLAEGLDLRPVCVGEPVWEETGGSFGVWDPAVRGGIYGPVYGGADADSDSYEQKDGFCLGFSEADGAVAGTNLSWTGLAVPVTQTSTGRVVFDESYFYLSGGYLDLPNLEKIAVSVLHSVNYGFCEALAFIAPLAGLSKDCEHENRWSELVDVVKGDVVEFPLSLFPQVAGSVRFAVVRHHSAGSNPFAEYYGVEVPPDLMRLAGTYQIIHVMMPVVNVVVDLSANKAKNLLIKLKGRFSKLEAVFGRIDDFVKIGDFVKTRPDFGAETRLTQYLSEIVHRIIIATVAKGSGHRQRHSHRRIDCIGIGYLRRCPDRSEHIPATRRGRHRPGGRRCCLGNHVDCAGRCHKGRVNKSCPSLRPDRHRYWCR